MSETMNPAEREEYYEFFLKKWGADSQKKMAVEEMSELTKEICKSWREDLGDNTREIREEIADTLNMVEQLRYLYGFDEVEKIRDEKLKKCMDKATKNNGSAK